MTTWQVITCASILSFAGGLAVMHFGRGPEIVEKVRVETVVETKTEIQEKIVEIVVEKIVYKDKRVSTKSVKTLPDGTKIVKVKHSTTESKEVSSEQSKEESVQVSQEVSSGTSSEKYTARATINRYSLGVSTTVSNLKTQDWIQTDVTVGVRLGDLPLWLETGTNIGFDKWILGVRVEF